MRNTEEVRTGEYYFIRIVQMRVREHSDHSILTIRRPLWFAHPADVPAGTSRGIPSPISPRSGYTLNKK